MIVPRRGPADSAAVAKHYDDLDLFYREIWGEHLHHGLFDDPEEPHGVAVERLVDHLADRARIGSGDRVLDVGCGYGATARRLARTRGASVTGITLSEKQCRYARLRAEAEGLDGAVDFEVADWLAHPIAPGARDVVISIEALEHMADKAEFFGRALAALRPGGRLVVTAWTAGEASRPWQVRYLLEPICREGRLPSLGTAAEYAALCREAGFASVALEDLTAQVRPTWRAATHGILRGIVSEPRYRRFLFDRGQENRIFALTALRIRIAYAVGAMGYGVLTGERPA